MKPYSHNPVPLQARTGAAHGRSGYLLVTAVALLLLTGQPLARSTYCDSPSEIQLSGTEDSAIPVLHVCSTFETLDAGYTITNSAQVTVRAYHFTMGKLLNVDSGTLKVDIVPSRYWFTCAAGCHCNEIACPP